MEEICAPNLCTGCAACMNICPKEAIELTESGIAGYFHPVIDDSKCIDCRRCQKVCPVNNPLALFNPKRAIAANAADINEYRSSASGGVASVISRHIIREGGIVYGCALEDLNTIHHVRCSSEADLVRLKGSKYVQSNINYTYRQVLTDLRSNIKVLFIGTPCQVAGLKNFLKREYENLYCIDLVCHGVSSQKLLRDNVRDILEKYHCKASNKYKISFRRKYPDRAQRIQYGVYIDGVSLPDNSMKLPNNDYITGFMSGLIFRENCYSCPYARRERVGDITLGDFWGLDRNSKIARPAGMILISTDKGDTLISLISNQINYEERPLDEAQSSSEQLRKPSFRPQNREKFFLDYQKIGTKAYGKYLSSYRRKYYRQGLLRDLKYQINKIHVFRALYYSMKNNSLRKRLKNE